MKQSWTLNKNVLQHEVWNPFWKHS